MMSSAAAWSPSMILASLTRVQRVLLVERGDPLPPVGGRVGIGWRVDEVIDVLDIPIPAKVACASRDY